MSRDQRSEDNWALLWAQQKALERRTGLAVVFCLVPDFLGATLRQYAFMLKGLETLEKRLKAKQIEFFLITGPPGKKVPEFVGRCGAKLLVCDFDPLRAKRQWKNQIASRITIPFNEVDAHNIVPCWIASDKCEYAAYTFRPKIRRLIPEFLEDFPQLSTHPFSWPSNPSMPIDWHRLRSDLACDPSVPEASWIAPGENAARTSLENFIKERLAAYDKLRNDPNQNGQSDLSPHIHFGHLSAQRAALEVRKQVGCESSQEAFLEELIVRRELSDNFCNFNEAYDQFSGFPAWAQKSLADHLADKRPYAYDLEVLEQAKTHDALWNAAQMQMVKTGKMHGYMRMYWAKKILEWSLTPQIAQQWAVYLNDRYELDGRDPNGYAGIAWSIGGVHDRAWKERPVFGKIRYMSQRGARSKFDANRYIDAMTRIT